MIVVAGISGGPTTRIQTAETLMNVLISALSLYELFMRKLVMSTKFGVPGPILPLLALAVAILAACQLKESPEAIVVRLASPVAATVIAIEAVWKGELKISA